MSDAPVLTRPKPKRRRCFRIDVAKRRRIEAAIEAMITALDTIDDPDEDSQADDDPIDGDEIEGPDDIDDEPSLGASEHINQNLAWRTPDGWEFCADGEIELGTPDSSNPVSQEFNDARFGERDDREMHEDDEPSLGSLEHRIDQTGWAASAGNSCDLEDEHDGREPDDHHE